jgi:hypothetical protein
MEGSPLREADIRSVGHDIAIYRALKPTWLWSTDVIFYIRQSLQEENTASISVVCSALSLLFTTNYGFKETGDLYLLSYILLCFFYLILCANTLKQCNN